jgi:glycosyltransferase involved in cell wall biosynthesis
MNQIHILYVTNFFSPNNDGFSNASSYFVKALSQKFKVSVFTQVKGNDKESLNYTIHRVKLISSIPILRYILNRLYLAKKIKNLVKSKGCDLIFVETLTDPVLLFFLPKHLLCKTAIRLHSTEDTERMIFSREFGFFVKRIIIKYFLASKLRMIFSTNQFHIEFYKKYVLNDNVFEISKKFFLIIPNYPELNDVYSNFEFEKNRIENHNGKINFLFVGKMSKLGVLQKGHHDLLGALKLFDQLSLTKFKITFVGKGTSFNEISNRLKLIENLDYEIHEYLPKEIMKQTLISSDAIILPSRFEGFSMFALEALTFHKPLILAKTGGLLDIVYNNELAFSSQDLLGLYKAMNLFLSFDLDKKLELVEQSKLKIESIFELSLERLMQVVILNTKGI